MTTDYKTLAAWAESGAPHETPASVELFGADAAARGREMLRRAGRPSLDGTVGADRSPRRQVRLPHQTNEALDAYATAHHMTASAVIRDALDHYLATAV